MDFERHKDIKKSLELGIYVKRNFDYEESVSIWIDKIGIKVIDDYLKERNCVEDWDHVKKAIRYYLIDYITVKEKRVTLDCLKRCYNTIMYQYKFFPKPDTILIRKDSNTTYSRPKDSV